MVICDYGCLQEAKYTFKNGKKCCSKSFHSCPEIRKNKSDKYSGSKNPMYGRKHKKETIDLISKSLKDIYLKNGAPNKGKKFSREHIDNMSKAHKGKKRTLESIQKQKLAMKGLNNPWFGKKMSIEARNNMRLAQIRNRRDPNSFWNSKEYEKIKEETRNRMLMGQASYMNSFIKNPSKPQVKLYEMTKELYSQAILNYSCLNYSIDIAIPDLMVAIEYDGSYWHKDKEKDFIRQKELEDHGWKFIRYIDRIPSKEELCNTLEEYKV